MHSDPMKRRRAYSKLFYPSLLVVCLLVPAWAQTMQDQLHQALDKVPHPLSAADFQSVPHLACLNQGKTFVCWSFATCSYLESEMARLKLDSVRLSVTYPVYCAYLEKARRFVRTKGGSRFAAGDLFTGVFDVCREYGAVPASIYEKASGGGAFDHTGLYAETDSFIQRVKLEGNWDEATVLAGLRKVLNRHLGEPPETFAYNGKTYTPKTFLAEVVRLPWKEYLMLTSFESAPFNTFTELKVDDNWRHNTNFFNVPLPVFYDGLKRALRAGFSAAIDFDNTEPSYQITGRYCIIPEFDLPASQVSQAAREMRFRDGGTSDDHAIHMIGHKEFQGEDWFLAKDSGKGAWRNDNQGVLLLHGPYVKLKVLAFLVHRDAVPQVTAILPGGTQARTH
jgi:bleomycin hydrolase